MRKVLAFLWRPHVALFGPLGALSLYFLSIGPFVWLIWNQPLPRWIAIATVCIYSPAEWVADKSEFFRAIAEIYVGLWVDMSVRGGQPATAAVPMPDEPPFFIEMSATLLGAWLVWHFIRWINLRKVPTSA